MGVQLIRPNKLRVGDTIATVSLSWGGAGDERLLWRYQVGKKRLEEQFGLKVIEMENTMLYSFLRHQKTHHTHLIWNIG